MQTKLRFFQIPISLEKTIGVWVPMIFDSELKEYILTPEAHTILDEAKKKNQTPEIPLTYEDMVPWLGEANAYLCTLPKKEFEAEIAKQQANFDTPNDLNWPTEYGAGTWNP